MNQKYFRSLGAAAVLFTGTLAACNETSELQEVVLPVPAEETSGFPRIPVKVDTTLTLRVLYRPANGCGRFSRVDSVKSTLQTDIRIFAAYPADEQEAICSDIAKLVPFTFRFRTTTPGVHKFRFWQTDNSFLLDSIVVE
jgi:hypothetical protein